MVGFTVTATVFTLPFISSKISVQLLIDMFLLEFSKKIKPKKDAPQLIACLAILMSFTPQILMYALVTLCFDEKF